MMVMMAKIASGFWPSFTLILEKSYVKGVCVQKLGKDDPNNNLTMRQKLEEPWAWVFK